MKRYLRHNMNVFEKIEWLKQLAADAIGVTDFLVLRRMISRLRRKGTAEFRKYGVLKFTQQELVLDQILKANEVSPKTAYRWFFLLKAPKEVIESGQQDRISQNEMLRRYSSVRRKSDPEQDKLGQEIIQDILKLIEVI